MDLAMCSVVFLDIFYVLNYSSETFMWYINLPSSLYVLRIFFSNLLLLHYHMIYVISVFYHNLMFDQFYSTPSCFEELPFCCYIWLKTSIQTHRIKRYHSCYKNLNIAPLLGFSIRNYDNSVGVVKFMKIHSTFIYCSPHCNLNN
jgi:hypothetical protein